LFRIAIAVNLLEPLGLFDLLRSAFFSAVIFFVPGFLLLKLIGKEREFKEDGIGQHAGLKNSEGKLFSGFIETPVASVFLSLLISAVVFSFLMFSVGLTSATALVGLATVIFIEGVLLWKKKA
jgi:hypothetical protein